jgi:hypothetical protein
VIIAWAQVASANVIIAWTLITNTSVIIAWTQVTSANVIIAWTLITNTSVMIARTLDAMPRQGVSASRRGSWVGHRPPHSGGTTRTTLGRFLIKMGPRAISASALVTMGPRAISGSPLVKIASGS